MPGVVWLRQTTWRMGTEVVVFLKVFLYLSGLL